MLSPEVKKKFDRIEAKWNRRRPDGSYNMRLPAYEFPLDYLEGDDSAFVSEDNSDELS